MLENYVRSTTAVFALGCIAGLAAGQTPALTIQTGAPPAPAIAGSTGHIRKITLEQVKRAADPPVSSPVSRLGQFSIEAAKQHRLGVQADYFPKFGATFTNLHFTDFLGQYLTLRRPIPGGPLVQVPLPIFSQNQTIAALTFTQPITPLFIVHQAVRIARADERVAVAKAAVSVAKNARQQELEEAYFKLLIAQRRLTDSELKLRNAESRTVYAAASIEPVRGPAGRETELADARKTRDTAAAEAKQLTASLNQAMGWPEHTELDPAIPEPLVENISLDEVADKSGAGNLEVLEAEQNVVKARAASAISKLEYVPTVAAVSGFLFQNAIPALPSSFGYGGVFASYNLFDFGKREHAVKEARAQLGMAEMALQLTKAKVAGDVKKSYLDLERSRQLSQMASKMGSSVASLMNVSTNTDTLEMRAARAEVEIEMIEADLAHRQAFARLKALMGSRP
ncbi:MAG TPA: TolC family protein [Bryobacteraceae bacterium]